MILGREIDIIRDKGKQSNCIVKVKQFEEGRRFIIEIPVNNVNSTDFQINKAVVDICEAGLSRSIDKLLNPILEGKQLPAEFFKTGSCSCCLN